jgi:hypothetical protein
MAMILNGDGAQINDRSKGTLWVVDNYYKDPYAIRDFALQQEYGEGGFGRGFMGNRTGEQFIVDGTKESFERIMGKKITNWTETYQVCGVFQYCTAKDHLVYHADSQMYAGVVYLTPDAPYETGTSLIAHRKTRVRHSSEPGADEMWADAAPTGCFVDSTPWQEVDVVGNVFNRLVLWDGHCPHTASKYFGFTKETSRLFHIFFFDVEE